MRSLTLFILVGALLFAMPVLAQDAASRVPAPIRKS